MHDNKQTTLAHPWEVLTNNSRTWTRRLIQRITFIAKEMARSRCTFRECMDPMCNMSHSLDRARIEGIAVGVVKHVCLAPFVRPGVLSEGTLFPCERH